MKGMWVAGDDKSEAQLLIGRQSHCSWMNSSHANNRQQLFSTQELDECAQETSNVRFVIIDLSYKVTEKKLKRSISRLDYSVVSLKVYSCTRANTICLDGEFLGNKFKCFSHLLCFNYSSHLGYYWSFFRSCQTAITWAILCSKNKNKPVFLRCSSEVGE